VRPALTLFRRYGTQRIPARFPAQEELVMRFPPNWPMELVLCVALFLSIVVLIFAMQDPPGDRTRFTLERNDVTHAIGVRRAPLLEDAAPGR
jgi:hypothetical protein